MPSDDVILEARAIEKSFGTGPARVEGPARQVQPVEEALGAGREDRPNNPSE